VWQSASVFGELEKASTDSGTWWRLLSGTLVTEALVEVIVVCVRMSVTGSDWREWLISGASTSALPLVESSSAAIAASASATVVTSIVCISHWNWTRGAGVMARVVLMY
jgi:hypothetical protein